VCNVRLVEWEAKALLRAEGIALPRGERAASPERVAEAATRLGGPVVVKSQVPVGGRMKAGGVRFADTPDEARTVAADLLSRPLLGHAVSELLVEERAPAGSEVLAAISYDAAEKAPVVLLTLAGGIDVEASVGGGSGGLARHVVDMTWPYSAYKGRELAARAGLAGAQLVAAGTLLQRLCGLFHQYDATLVEVNPVVWTGKGFLALDAHVELEDEALFRHPELPERFGIQPRPTQVRPPTVFEAEAARIDATDSRGVAGRMVEFDGDLGLLIGGGGASLTVFDALLAAGGRPANYCEVGGNPSVRKVCALTRLILQKPGVRRLAVIMNVVSNTRADLIARGVIKGIVEEGLVPSEVVTVFRVPGAWEAEGARILERYGIAFSDRTVSLDEAARLAVSRRG
jgi:succinyl-CoA synthetase beta subunit